jgi:chromosome segregation ATPase
MPEELNTITLGENTLRLETLTLPNGNTYNLGCSFEEAQQIYNVLSGNINKINDELEENEEVVAGALTDLNLRANALSQDVETLTETTETISGAVTAIDERVDSLETFVEDAEDTELAISAALNDLSQKITALTQENASLRSDIDTLRQEIAAIKNA